MRAKLTGSQKRALQIACIRGVETSELKYVDSAEILQREGYLYLDQPSLTYRPTREGKLLAEELVTGRGFVDAETYKALTARKPTEEQERIVKAFDLKYDLYAPVGYKTGRKKAS